MGEITVRVNLPNGRVRWPQGKPGAKPATDPYDYDPPPGLQTFYIRLIPVKGPRGHRTLSALTDLEIDWVRRVAGAEIARRRSA